MNFKTLLSVMILAESNMRVIHWKCATIQFDGTHAIAQEYYDMISEDMDNIAEMGMRLGSNVMTYDDAFRMLDAQSSGNYVKVDATLDFDRPGAFTNMNNVMVMVRDALLAEHESSEMNEPMNIGIKSELESLINKYDHEIRYKLARRMRTIG